MLTHNLIAIAADGRTVTIQKLLYPNGWKVGLLDVDKSLLVELEAPLLESALQYLQDAGGRALYAKRNPETKLVVKDSQTNGCEA
jgi:hypothetical protein